MVLPFENFSGNSTGENFIWQKCKEYLPDNYISFHNYYLNLNQADLIMLVPNLGVLTIEIKGYYAKNIIDAPDNSIIRIKNSPPIPSPLSQAVKCRNLLLEKFMYDSNIDSVYVVPVVAYPYITENEYVEKGLDKISSRELTITADDFHDNDIFVAKLQKIFKFAYENINVPTLVKFGFNDELLQKAGDVISPGFADNKILPDNDLMVKTQIEDINKISTTASGNKNYSELYYVKSEDSDNLNIINTIVSNWLQGTKIFFYTDDNSMIDILTQIINSVLIEKNLSDRKAFALGETSTFLFSFGIAPKMDKSFIIYNGEKQLEYTKELEFLHNNSAFNMDQYIIEHADINDIIVKAGAGTGKTYSIVSRINYLVWTKDYDALDLSKRIAMITFTNESANDMKKKLSDNFLNHYLLTSNSKFLDYVEFVEDMSISTIHSMAKKIIQSFSPFLGLGKNFSIVTGNYKRRQILKNKLDDFLEKHKNIESQIDISMFHLSERLIGLMEKLDNKNIDIARDYKKLNFGRSNSSIFTKLLDVIHSTQSELDLYCHENNSVSLGDLIRQLKLLHNNINKQQTQTNVKIDFLFVDEFQDTDDVQIELILAFKEIFKFNFFVVGDVKQCIYRFRGAEVKAFDTLTKQNSSLIKTFSLNKNYRTDTHLMNKLNEIFKSWNDDGDIEYMKDDVLIGTKNYCSSSQLFNASYTNEIDFEEKLKNAITSASSDLTDTKSKIAILVRYNWQITKIREICEKNKIKIETDIGGELFKIDPTIDLFKLLSALKYNTDPKYLYNLYSTSFISEKLPKIELLDEERLNIKDYFYNNLPFTLGKWNSYITRLREEPVLKVVRDIIDDVKPWEIFANKITSDANELNRLESFYIRNLDQLFESLIIASNTDYLTLNKLSDYLEIMILTRKDEEARESYDINKSNAQIICTTVHKSKGLEFDTIILPYCDFDISSAKTKGDVDLIYSNNEIGYRIIGNNYKILFENDLYQNFKSDEVRDRKHEETRILYVALTRAIRKIIYFNDISKDTKKATDNWSNLIKEV